jgi:hypothetical protein
MFMRTALVVLAAVESAAHSQAQSAQWDQRDYASIDGTVCNRSVHGTV